eukprot:scaffold19069_cov80-Skeletonema_marinoi.AAC.1
MLASISNRYSYPITTIWMMMAFIQLLVLLSSVDSFLIQPSQVQRRHVTCTHIRTTTTVLESSPSTISDTDPASEREDMPWGNVQKWALEDNIGKFTVTIPSSKKRVALWRTMAREVTELAGYPIPFLVKMHKRSLNTDDGSNNTSASTSECPGVLPMVDDFEFASNGGVVGSAYGIPGIADGTRINTPPL